MFRRKMLTAVAVASAVSLAVTGCTSTSGTDNTTNASGTKTGGTLTLGVLFPATSFAAQDANWANEAPYGQAVYDTLLRSDPTGKIIPGLATEWKYNDARTTLSLTVRSDVTFTDGTKFDAEAAAQNLVRFRDGASSNKSFLTKLKDAKAVDPTHVEVTLTESDPALLTYLSQNAGQIEAPSAFKNADLKTKPVGSGPYILDLPNTVPGSSYTFTKNPNYWDKANQHYEKLVLKVFGDPTALLNATKGGQLTAGIANNNTLDQLKASGYNIISREGDWLGLILYDRAGTLNPALKEPKVRQAINYAFDRAALLTAIGKDQGTITTQVFPTTSVAYDPELDKRYPYDPAKGKALLGEAGFPNGFTLNMPSTTLAAPSTYVLLTQQLKDIGITANLTDAGSNFISDQLSAKYPASFMQLQQDSDWQLINFMLSPTSTWNSFKFSDPKADALIKTIHDAKTDAESAPALKELNKYVVEQAWFAPWYRNKGNFFTDSKTTAVMQADNSYPYLWNIKPKA